MANYDITMKQYNGIDYDILFPQNQGEQVLLNNNSLKALLGIALTNPHINDAIDALIKNSMEFVSYMGTGVYGSENQNSLQFNFNPRFIYIISSEACGIIVNDVYQNTQIKCGYSTFAINGFFNLTVNFNTSNKTVNWYTTEGEQRQLNTSGITYYAIAFK